MPTIPPVNIQQILQMGTHAEKLQQTLQQLPQNNVQHLEEERKIQDEKKRVEIQDLDLSQESLAIYPDGSNQKRKKPARKTIQQEENASDRTKPAPGMETTQGHKIDLVV